MKNVLIAVLAGLLVVAVLYIFRKEPAPSAQNPQATSTPQTGGNATATPNAPTVTQIKIALLDTTGQGTGKARGCDTVNLVARTIPATTTPLAAAMHALFAAPEGSQPGTQYNFIARTKNTLHFERATVANGTAHIYLTGSLSGLAGVCDDPRAQIQIEETALQFSTVQKVQIYLNNQPTTLTPSQQ
jgi:spore germination protein GerM